MKSLSLVARRVEKRNKASDWSMKNRFVSDAYLLWFVRQEIKESSIIGKKCYDSFMDQT